MVSIRPLPGIGCIRSQAHQDYPQETGSLCPSPSGDWVYSEAIFVLVAALITGCYPSPSGNWVCWDPHSLKPPWPMTKCIRPLPGIGCIRSQDIPHIGTLLRSLYPSPSGDWVYSEAAIPATLSVRYDKYPSPSGDWVYSE